MSPADKWTEDDLKRLVGIPESSRLEFKSGRLFDQREKAVEDLSREVSAFANAEGGEIVLGISEREEGKSRIADRLDGIDPSSIPSQWLQQVVESNVSPYLSGLRFKTVKLSGELTGRVCVVIQVPKGSTAYQAKDRRYYGRSEFQVQALPDHEIRLRMQRGRTPAGFVEIWHAASEPWKSLPDERPIWSEEDTQEWAGRGPQTLLDLEWRQFKLCIHNTGEVTIRGFMLELRCTRSPGIVFAQNDAIVGEHVPEVLQFVAPVNVRVFPDQRVGFPDVVWTLTSERADDLTPGCAVVHWTLFVDDGQPTRGSFDVVQTISEYFQGKVPPFLKSGTG